MRKTFLIMLLLLISIALATAHQPRLVGDVGGDVLHSFSEINSLGVYEIKNPEVSQAFYAKLNGNPYTYILGSEEPFNLYVGISAPDVSDKRFDFQVEITKGDSTPVAVLDGTSQEWKYYYEQHAGDGYFRGPSFEVQGEKKWGHPKGVRVDPGFYKITVSNPDNQGKYVLVIGEKETFPLAEIANTVLIMPKIKQYFEKSPYQAFSTPTMKVFFAVFIWSIGIPLLVIYLLIHYVRKKLKK